VNLWLTQLANNPELTYQKCEVLKNEVEAETTQDNAQELGSNFVRVVKTFGPEALPGREIGSGIFDYEITVAYADGTRIAQGAKDSTGIRIAW